MNLLFKKPTIENKSFYWFTWFSIFSLLIGLATKIYVLYIATHGLVYTIDNKNFMPKKDYDSDFANSLSGVAIQALIIIVTVAIYPISIASQVKVLNGKKKLNEKTYRSYKREFIWFLAIFVFLDLTATSMITMAAVQHGAANVFTIQTIFIIATILIPTPLVIISLIWLKKFKSQIEK